MAACSRFAGREGNGKKMADRKKPSGKTISEKTPLFSEKTGIRDHGVYENS
jgi:hypothetical protein